MRLRKLLAFDECLVVPSQEMSQPDPYKHYYYGLPGRTPKLLARTGRDAWVPQTASPGLYSTFTGIAPKLHFNLKNHPLKECLDNGGLRENIRAVLRGMNPVTWICICYVRLGYSMEETENPVVILVIAEKDKTSKLEAQRMVDLIHDECMK